MRELDMSAVVSVLVRHGVDFLVIGGAAGVLQGSPLPTQDIDIVPTRERDNLQRLSDALRELEAKVRAGDEQALPFDHATSLAGSVFWNLSTKHGDLDITFTPTGTDGYDDLRREAVEVTLGGTPVLLASLGDIIRSKEAAGRDKDRRSLPILRELLAEQLRNRRP